MPAISMMYTKDFLEKLYWMMLRIRVCEESLVEPIFKGEIKTPCHLYSGQEAVATGIGAALMPQDYIFGNHRSHGHYLAKGGDMAEMIAEIYGKESGCSRGRGGSMHLISPENGILGIVPIVSGTISLALGAALSIKIKKENKVTVSFFGDGATGEGVLYESMNFAALKKLPIIFACENNLYSTHLPINEIRTNRNIFNIADPFEIESYRVDGNNVLEVLEVAQKAVESCRSGKGPVFIEFLTYRFRGHVGPDDNIQGSHTDIRPIEEIAVWKEKDPLILFKKYLIDNSFSTEEDIGSIHQKVDEEVKAANDFAINSSKPAKEDLCKYVFK
jgi:acetoin:2,6-dichlorophenolindophenol oxidoreductase subunit alpha